MTQYIIMGIKKDGQKRYMQTDGKDYKWVRYHKQATHFNLHDEALKEWNYIIKFHSNNFKRIFVPIYDINEVPWNE